MPKILIFYNLVNVQLQISLFLNCAFYFRKLQLSNQQKEQLEMCTMFRNQAALKMHNFTKILILDGLINIGHLIISLNCIFLFKNFLFLNWNKFYFLILAIFGKNSNLKPFKVLEKSFKILIFTTWWMWGFKLVVFSIALYILENCSFQTKRNSNFKFLQCLKIISC